MKLPPEQEAIQAKCFHRSGNFVEFSAEEIAQSIPARFEQQVVKYDGHVAVRSRSHQLTYGNLNKIANRIGRAILAQRGEKDEPIALLLGNNATVISSIVGVMKSGKTCVPLETACPPSRIRYILQDSETRLLVTDNICLPLAHESVDGSADIINIDELDSSSADENLGLNISPETLAYILYTSGSTGQPKGVTQTHRNALHSAMAYVNSLHIGTDDRLTLLAPCSGAQGMKIAISALVTGAALYPWNIKEDGLSELAGWLITAGITVYISSATVFRSFVAALRGTEQFPGIRVVRLGNEPVRRADWELYKKHFSSDCFLVNWFAATEAGSVACYFIDNTNIHGEFIPVGYVFDDTEILLLDDNGQQIGFNQIGEIAIKSRYLSQGYWHQPELTRAKFLPDPKGGDERSFLSGDLGFMLSDGRLYHVGRKDFQVKISGNRIEVGEVETALLALDAIKDAAVIARDQPGGEKRLVAYLVAAENPPPGVAPLRRALAENLPDHMIPSTFVFLDAMPLTPNGKIDRRALPEPEGARPELPLAYVAPRIPLEEILAKIWADIIGLDRVGVHDNFFELGGDSLLAARIVSQVTRHFDLDLRLQSLFDSPTVAEMAAAMSQCPGKKLDEQQLENVIAELESLTEDEAQRLVSGVN